MTLSAEAADERQRQVRAAVADLLPRLAARASDAQRQPQHDASADDRAAA